MVQPHNIRHFWDPKEAAYDAIVTVKDAGTNYHDKDVTCAAWQAICDIYFPRAASTAGGVKYLVHRNIHRGLPSAHGRQQKPDVVVVELRMPQDAVRAPDGLQRSVRREVLWVECGAPSEHELDQPSGWVTLMMGATRRLSAAHPTRSVWLIVAAGLEWMVFYWDPSNKVRDPPLRIVASAATDRGQRILWDVDQRVHAAPVAGQRHIDQDGVVCSDRANSLDFWTQAALVPAPGQTPRPLNMNSCLILLENVLQAVQTGDYA